MTTQEFRTAFLNAIDSLGQAGTPLDEFAVLTTLAKLCDARKDDIKEDAITQAEEQLRLAQRTSGRFCYEGRTFSLDKKIVFDFVGKPQRYTMPEGVHYRELAKEQAELRTQASSITTLLNAITKNFQVSHSEFEPDTVNKVLKVVE